VDEIIQLPKSFPVPDALKKDVKENGLAFVDDLAIKDGKVSVKKDQDSLSFPYKEFYRETGDLE
jgi:hypothetical protein